MLDNLSFILFWMVFMHIVDDYYLQGWLASAKQRSWWEKNAPNKLYSKDYLMALSCHGFSWAFMSMLPLAISHYREWWVGLVIINAVIHCLIDNLKANKLKINLITDQILHIVQILISWFIYMVLQLQFLIKIEIVEMLIG